MSTVRKAMDINAVKEFIRNQNPESKIYIGSDSERFKIDGEWYADYMTVVVVHINGHNGCRVFGQIERERDWDQRKDRPAQRLMNEVYRTSGMYLALEDALDGHEVEIHLDINPDEKFGSSCVIQQAIGYIRGTCNVVPMVKPNAWAASFGADRLKDYIGTPISKKAA